MIFVFTDFALLILSFLAILLILGQRDLPLTCLTYSPLLCRCHACTITSEYARSVGFSTAKTPSIAKPQLCFSHRRGRRGAPVLPAGPLGPGPSACVSIWQARERKGSLEGLRCHRAAHASLCRLHTDPVACHAVAVLGTAGRCS